MMTAKRDSRMQEGIIREELINRIKLHLYRYASYLSDLSKVQDLCDPR